ncbi:MAG: glycine--tRNA ligase subunit beta, partial [Burkholderiaceae bacterium]
MTGTTAVTEPQTPASAPLLVELFTEELPPKALERLGDAFADGIAAGLAQHGLLAGDPADGRQTFATPRRLAVRLPAVIERAPDRRVELKGPSLKVGLDAQGAPTQALHKWADRQGVAIDALRRGSDGKQEVFFADSVVQGQTLDAVLQSVIDDALGRLPIPKLMQYQLADGRTSVSFVRPAHGLVALHGNRVVPATVLGLDAGRTTRGHRFQSSGELTLSHADDYAQTLERDGRVIAGFDERRARIDEALRATAASLDASLGDESGVAPLLDEVTALVEWPAVYVGRFDAQFLQVPQECLILTMRTNQKYFPLFDAQGRLLPEFLIVSNMAVPDPRFIIDGNQRVVRPRLADARFFFETDQKTRLDARVPQLASVIYHARLGTQAQRSDRVRRIASAIAAALGEDPAPAERAALLAKTDLLTGMVGE